MRSIEEKEKELACLLWELNFCLILLYWVTGGYGFPGTVYIGLIARSDIFLHYNFVTTFF
jgi:hypothetical protein